LPPETTSSQECELVRAYYCQLDVTDYSFDDLWRDYRRGLMLTLTSLAPTDSVEIDEGRGQEMMDLWRKRLAARLQHVELDTLL